jgi:septum formation protein
VEQPTRLVLASASPRRLDLLRHLGLTPVPRPSNLHEDVLPEESPRDLVLRLAEAKGRSVASSLGPDEPASVVLAADTGVVIDGHALGKPRDPEDARSMLRTLRGRTHQVMTSVFLLRTDDGRHTCDLERTRVTFRDYDEATIDAYVSTCEPLDKAGAYGIQGGGADLVDRVEGSWTNVVGLPLERLDGWLARIGVDLKRLVRAE